MAACERAQPANPHSQQSPLISSNRPASGSPRRPAQANPVAYCPRRPTWPPAARVSASTASEEQEGWAGRGQGWQSGTGRGVGYGSSQTSSSCVPPSPPLLLLDQQIVSNQPFPPLALVSRPFLPTLDGFPAPTATSGDNCRQAAHPRVELLDDAFENFSDTSAHLPERKV